MTTLVLDTETTGLGDDAEILEIGICDLNSNIIYDQRIKPTVNEWHGAQLIHGISKEDVKNCPTFKDIEEKLKSILIGNEIIIFNSDYDIRLLSQSAKKYDLNTDWIRDLDVKCCMYASGDFWPDHANFYGGMKLVKAIDLAGISFIGKPHSAISDALSTAEVWKHIN